MRFLGIDLGWLSGATGLCRLELRGGQLQPLALHRETEIPDILAWINCWLFAAAPGMIAVDVPDYSQCHRYA